MINTEMMLGYIVKGKHSIASVAENLKMSELDFIKCVANISDFDVCQILSLCDLLKVKSEDCMALFFSEYVPVLL